ncbi:uncharacterized protein KY384_004681 [Bacidia gigantensis]|uniref:uncharacterized protein n=1 Tax=Bacidia gigantensis TaxID=2732470 RepID=UPI001D053B6B|nr:uncharacterized protein KY384_004681 [Bacidia gigantensis]KAG8530643.1 hypothetical protein KY384_004681 [Bacidia gigantensis]
MLPDAALNINVEPAGAWLQLGTFQGLGQSVELDFLEIVVDIFVTGAPASNCADDQSKPKLYSLHLRTLKPELYSKIDFSRYDRKQIVLFLMVPEVEVVELSNQVICGVQNVHADMLSPTGAPVARHLCDT